VINDILKDLGVGMSWGFGGIRIGRSGSGTWWISVGIPRTGIRMSKVFYRQRRSFSPANSSLSSTASATPPAISAGTNAPVTPNQEILREMERLKIGRP
jgi:hypothetical protein